MYDIYIYGILCHMSNVLTNSQMSQELQLKEYSFWEPIQRTWHPQNCGTESSSYASPQSAIKVKVCKRIIFSYLLWMFFHFLCFRVFPRHVAVVQRLGQSGPTSSCWYIRNIDFTWLYPFIACLSMAFLYSWSLSSFWSASCKYVAPSADLHPLEDPLHEQPGNWSLPWSASLNMSMITISYNLHLKNDMVTWSAQPSTPNRMVYP